MSDVRFIHSILLASLQSASAAREEAAERRARAVAEGCAIVDELRLAPLPSGVEVRVDESDGGVRLRNATRSRSVFLGWLHKPAELRERLSDPTLGESILELADADANAMCRQSEARVARWEEERAADAASAASSASTLRLLALGTGALGCVALALRVLVLAVPLLASCLVLAALGGSAAGKARMLRA